jgi:hypothetical protein
MSLLAPFLLSPGSSYDSGLRKWRSEHLLLHVPYRTARFSLDRAYDWLAHCYVSLIYPHLAIARPC